MFTPIARRVVCIVSPPHCGHPGVCVGCTRRVTRGQTWVKSVHPPTQSVGRSVTRSTPSAHRSLRRCCCNVCKTRIFRRSSHGSISQRRTSSLTCVSIVPEIKRSIAWVWLIFAFTPCSLYFQMSHRVHTLFFYHVHISCLFVVVFSFLFLVSAAAELIIVRGRCI